MDITPFQRGRSVAAGGRVGLGDLRNQTSKIVTAQSIETKLLEQQTRQVSALLFPPLHPAYPAPTSLPTNYDLRATNG